MSSAAAKAVRELRRLAEQQGFTVEPMKHNHLRWRAPSGDTVGSCCTPSDTRALANLKADLRRLGLVLPRKDGRRA